MQFELGQNPVLGTTNIPFYFKIILETKRENIKIDIKIIIVQ